MKRRDFIKYGATLAGVGGACLICKNQFFISEPQTAIQNPMDTRPCRVPFEFAEVIYNGDVYPCCKDFLKYNEDYVGNIEKNSPDEIWNGKLYTDLRQRMLKGDFSMCNRNICVYHPCDKENLPSEYQKGPQELKISYDFECNYNCITCRDEIIMNTPEKTKLYEEVYLPKIIEIAKNSEVVNLLGTGDPLFSRHSRNIIKTLIKKYPEIKFNISTNGFLLNEENINELTIQNNIRGVFVSVDATNRETYKKILKTDGFDTVMKNIKLMSEWKKQGKIDILTLNFVVHIMNYKEMPEFLQMSKKLGAFVFFSTYRPWPSAEYHKRYDEVAVFEPTNKHYKELVKILHNPIFKDREHCYLEPRLADIANL